GEMAGGRFQLLAADPAGGPLAQSLQRPAPAWTAAAIAGGAAVTPIAVDGRPAYGLAAMGDGLDAALLPAFALLGKQLGAAIETVRRLDELARKNRELLLVSHVARATATLGTGVALQAALDHVAAAVAASAIALFRREDEELTLAVSRGFPFGWATSHQRVPLRSSELWVEAALTRATVHFSLENEVALRRAPRAATP